MPNRLHVVGAAVLAGVLFVLMLLLDQADEDSTLGTLADWTWVAFMISLVLLVVIVVWALIGRLRASRA
jgi:hypothetical protein